MTKKEGRERGKRVSALGRHIFIVDRLHFIWETRFSKAKFQIEILTLVQNITENRPRHARGPVHYIESVTFINYIFLHVKTRTWIFVKTQ